MLQAVDKGKKIGAMDMLYDQKLVFVTSHSDDETGIYTYPIPEKLDQFQKVGTQLGSFAPENTTQGPSSKPDQFQGGYITP